MPTLLCGGLDRERLTGRDQSPGQPARQSGTKRVLLFDDDPIFRRLCQSYGKSAGFEIDAYESLAELGSFALIGSYDLAIIDYRLPIMSGTEIAEYVDVFFSPLPVILVSAENPREIPLDSLKPCIRAFVSKSEGIREIIRTAAEILWPPGSPELEALKRDGLRSQALPARGH